MRLTGKSSSRKLAAYGEKVLAQVAQDKRSKLTTRWVAGVFVGVQESLHNTREHYIVLTEAGAILSRTVKRLVPSSRWDRDLLQRAQGLPWDTKASKVRHLHLQGKPLAVPLEVAPEDLAREVLEVVPEMEARATAAAAAATTPLAPNTTTVATEQQATAATASNALEVPVPTLLATENADGPDVIPVPMETGTTSPMEREVKRSRVQAILGPLAAHVNVDLLCAFLADEVPEVEQQACDSLVAGLEELGQFLNKEPAGVDVSRREEISKLEDTFKLFKVVQRSAVPQGTKIYGHKWVDATRHGKPKSRLTVQDFRHIAHRHEAKMKQSGTWSTEDMENVQCPTPAGLTNRTLAWLAVHKSYPMLIFDVMSAFVHAREHQSGVYLVPPREWEQDKGIPEHTVLWHLVGNLYGRRSGPSNFRDHFEGILLSWPEAQFTRGVIEPCVYHSKPLDLTISHH
eukprot:6465336-Amphidinium_carterae.1